MNARDIMSKDPVSIRSDNSIDAAIRQMLDRHISGLPVVGDLGQLVGIVTEGDLLRRTELGTERHRPRWLSFLIGSGRLAEDYAHSHGRKVSEVMTESVVTASAGATLAQLVDLMVTNEVKRVVIAENDRPIGIVSRADVLRALDRTLPAAWPQPQREDADILAEIKAEFARAPGLPVGSIDVSVEDGQATLRGTLSDERERAAVRVAVENVSGVRGIHDHMMWVEPLSGLFTLSPEDRAAEKAAAGN